MTPSYPFLARVEIHPIAPGPKFRELIYYWAVLRIILWRLHQLQIDLGGFVRPLVTGTTSEDNDLNSSGSASHLRSSRSHNFMDHMAVHQRHLRVLGTKEGGVGGYRGPAYGYRREKHVKTTRGRGVAASAIFFALGLCVSEKPTLSGSQVNRGNPPPGIDC